jgi:transcriptional regulator with XRE-family HTH domain
MATSVKRFQGDPINQLVKDIEYEVWITNQIANCVRHVANGGQLCQNGFVDCLAYWANRFEFKKPADIAKAFGCSGSSVSNWMTDKSVPRLRMTVNIAWVFGVGLVEFLNKVIPPSHSGRLQAPQEPFTRYVGTSRRRPIDRHKMEEELRAIIRENRYPTLSFREICEQKLKRGPTIVRDYFPELAKELARRNLGNRRLKAQVEKNQYCESIRTYAKILHEKGIIPNHKTLAHFIDHPSRLRCSWAVEALKQIRLELGYETNDEQLELAL